MRLGEILVRAGVLDVEQLGAALRQQVVYGGRLGTNIIELGYSDADQVARALAHQHGVPAALRRQLGRHDPAVLPLVPRALAASATVIPIAYSLAGGNRRLVVCMRDPADEAAQREITAAARLPMVACVAPELLVYALLERLYEVASPRRLATAAHGQARPLPHSGSHQIPPPPSDDSIDIVFDDTEEVAPLSMQLVDLDDEGVTRDLSQYVHTSSRNTEEISATIWAAASATEGREIADNARTGMEQAIAAAAAIARTVPGLADELRGDEAPPEPTEAPPEPTEAPPEPAAAPTLTMHEARAAILRAAHRDAVQRAVVDYMRGCFGGGLVLLAKDGLALGAAGFGGLFDDETVESIVVPLSVPSMLAIAHDTCAPFHGPPPAAGHAVQERLFKLFPLSAPPRDTIVTPVVIRDRVVCLYYAHAPGGGAIDSDAADGLRALAADAAATFVRMIRGGKRKPA